MIVTDGAVDSQEGPRRRKAGGFASHGFMHALQTIFPGGLSGLMKLVRAAG